MDLNTTIESRERVRAAHEILDLHTISPVEKRSRIGSTSSGLQAHEPFVSRTAKIVRCESPLYTPGTPIYYTFHSCNAALIIESLRLIHTEDLPMNLNLETMTFSLPKHVNDDGLAIPWLVSLTACLAWCFHRSSAPDIIIAEPELGIEKPSMTVNESEAPSLRSDLHTGSTASQASEELSTTATDLVQSFLEFAQGLPSTELATEEQAIFAFADFLHNRPDKCKSCVLWRAAWKECLTRLYGQVVAKSMARQRKFQTTSL